MINSRIQIENGAIEDFYTKWGFIYKDADERTAPDEKKPDTTSYAEEAGEHQDSRRVLDAFDYKAEFFIDAPNQNLKSVNAKIEAFNAAIRQKQTGTDIAIAKEITFYNDNNHVKIVGYPELIAVPTKAYYSPTLANYVDFAVVELKIRVTDPNKCNFDTVNNP